MRYRKRPIEIEAMRIDGTHNSALAAAMWAGAGIEARDGASEQIWVVMIDTLEGVMRADPGDYIIQEPFPTDNRKFYPCKSSIFESTYEAVND